MKEVGNAVMTGSEVAVVLVERCVVGGGSEGWPVTRVTVGG